MPWTGTTSAAKSGPLTSLSDRLSSAWPEPAGLAGGTNRSPSELDMSRWKCSRHGQMPPSGHACFTHADTATQQLSSSVKAMPIVVTQDEWDGRAAAVGIAWMAPVDSATTKTPARCLTCGFDWLATPATIARGGGCPECARWKKRRVAQEVWAARLAKHGLEPLEPVQRSNRKVRVRCRAAGHELEVWPAGIRGCRVCRDDELHPPQSVWDEHIARVDAEWLEPVRGFGTPTRARCHRCGRQRLAIPASVRAGAGCPCCGHAQQAAWDERIATDDANWRDPVHHTVGPVRANCLICGRLWMAAPSEVTRGGCPDCVRRTSLTTLERGVQRDHLRRFGCEAQQEPGYGPAWKPEAMTDPGVDRQCPDDQLSGIASLETPTSPIHPSWTPAPVRSDEPDRLSALRALRVLDSEPEPEFDDIVHLVSEICEVPLAFVSLVDAEREYFKAAVGTTRREAPRDESFCGHAIHAGNVFVVDDALQDPRFAGNPNVVAGDHVRFYAGAPLVTPGGYTVGMLCVKDTRPRELTMTQRHTLAVLGRQIEAQFELRRLRLADRGKPGSGRKTTLRLPRQTN